jgi:glyoxylase-like metal-dependent hydrolase (beta-lactamase superfamily II)
MLTVHKLVFNAFQENTFLIEAENKDCIIIDPGCSNALENDRLKSFVEEKSLKPVALVLTHFHLDHVFGNKFVFDTWSLLPTGHKDGEATLNGNKRACEAYGLPYIPSPPITHFIAHNDTVLLNNEIIKVLHVPGHSTGHVALVNTEANWVIAGDVLFQNSIGRTDLPGGDFDVLEKSIREKMYLLPDEMVVYCGHGPETTIGNEKFANPFVRE